ncbi:MAG TPA: SAF domain-containing protein [Actinomycetaceae bacterium]|nr:SAF domain-containing protein [Actinomycetaceae bacterium]
MVLLNRPFRASPVRRASRAAGWRAAAWRWRHVFLAISLAAGTLTVADALAHDDDGAAAVVLTAELAAGHVLRTGDLELTAFSPAVEGSLSGLADAVGETLAVGLPSGTPLTAGMLLGPELADTAPAGTTVVTVQVADPGSRALAQPGSNITLVGETVDGTGLMVARDVRVLSQLDGEVSNGLLGTENCNAFLIVAVPDEIVNLVLASSARASLRVAVTPID